MRLERCREKIRYEIVRWDERDQRALDAKLAKKIPKRMTGRTLSLDEAAALLDRL